MEIIRLSTLRGFSKPCSKLVSAGVVLLMAALTVRTAHTEEETFTPLGPEPNAVVRTPDGAFRTSVMRAQSKNGRHIACVSTSRGLDRVEVDGQPAGPEYNLIRDLKFSDDGKRFVYRARRGRQWQVVVDGIPGPEYDQIWPPLLLSADGKRFAYQAQKGNRALVVLDGKPGPECDDVGSLRFSIDGKHLAYTARDGRRWWAVIDGMPAPETREGLPALSAPLRSQAIPMTPV